MSRTVVNKSPKNRPCLPGTFVLATLTRPFCDTKRRLRWAATCELSARLNSGCSFAGLLLRTIVSSVGILIQRRVRRCIHALGIRTLALKAKSKVSTIYQTSLVFYRTGATIRQPEKLAPRDCFVLMQLLFLCVRNQIPINMSVQPEPAQHPLTRKMLKWVEACFVINKTTCNIIRFQYVRHRIRPYG